MDILSIYETLLQRNGNQNWWPGETRDEVVIGAILAQSVSWSNVEKALQKLKEAGLCSLSGIQKAPIDTLAQLLRSTLYYNQKAARLKAFTQFLNLGFAGDLDRLFALPLPELRPKLLAIKGLGPETVDSILLYAGDLPVMVVDAYTDRLLSRLGFIPEARSYDGWQKLICLALPQDVALYKDFHAQIVIQCKNFCARKPRCGDCPLACSCPQSLIIP